MSADEPRALPQVHQAEHKKFFRAVRDLSPAKLVFHSCGSVASIIEDLIEIGWSLNRPAHAPG